MSIDTLSVLPKNDHRGISEVIGVVLLFAIFVIAFSTYQAFFVPQQNSEVEFNAYQSASGDMTDLHNKLIASGVRGVDTSTMIMTGTTYPSRLIALNPPAPTGTLATGSPRTVIFENVSAVASEATNTRSFWNVTGQKAYRNATTGITFTPEYNAFSGQPIVATGETVYTVGENKVAPLGDQSLLTGNQLRLIFVDGDLRVRGLEASVAASSVSSATRTVTVTGQDGPLTLRLDPPPQATADEWVGAYGTSLAESNPRVKAVDSTNGHIVLKLNSSRTYQLQLARVVVSEQATSATVDPSYIITHQGNESVLDSGKRTTLVAEVRDRFNNPVAGTDVEFEITSGDATFLSADGNEISGNVTTVKTTAAGRAPQRLRVDAIGNDVLVTARIAGQPGTLNTTTFRIQTPSEDNPVQLAGVTFDGATKSGNQIDITFENQIDTDRNITKFRMHFHQGGNPQRGTIEGQSFEVGGSAISLDPQLIVPASTTQTFSLDFNDYNPSSGDWFIITVQYDTGDTAQYFGALE